MFWHTYSRMSDTTRPCGYRWRHCPTIRPVMYGISSRSPQETSERTPHTPYAEQPQHYTAIRTRYTGTLTKTKYHLPPYVQCTTPCRRHDNSSTLQTQLRTFSMQWVRLAVVQFFMEMFVEVRPQSQEDEQLATQPRPTPAQTPLRWALAPLNGCPPTAARLRKPRARTPCG